MKLTPEELGNLYRRGTARAGRPASCPPSEFLARAITRDALSAEERERLAGHLATCSDCSDELRRTSDPQPTLPLPLKVPLRSALPLLAAAAVLVLAAGVALQLRRPLSSPSSAPFRAESDPAEIRSLLPAKGLLARANCVLRWTGVSADARFGVIVATEDLSVLTKARELSSPEYRVPPEILAPLPHGARLVWRVEAVLPDGRRVASFSFVNILD